MLPFIDNITHHTPWGICWVAAKRSLRPPMAYQMCSLGTPCASAVRSFVPGDGFHLSHSILESGVVSRVGLAMTPLVLSSSIRAEPVCAGAGIGQFHTPPLVGPPGVGGGRLTAGLQTSS